MNNWDQFREFLRENAKAVRQWPKWMRAGARGESVVVNVQLKDLPKWKPRVFIDSRRYQDDAE